MADTPRRALRDGRPDVHLAVGGSSRTICGRFMTPGKGWGLSAFVGRQVNCKDCLATISGCFQAVVKSLAPMPPGFEEGMAADG